MEVLNKSYISKDLYVKLIMKDHHIKPTTWREPLMVGNPGVHEKRRIYNIHDNYKWWVVYLIVQTKSKNLILEKISGLFYTFLLSWKVLQDLGFL